MQIGYKNIFGKQNTLVLLDILHYIRSEFILTAGIMTATTSMVLSNRISYESCVIVALGTFIIYNFDNMLDWPGEKHLLFSIQRIWKQYVVICIILIPSFLIYIAILIKGNFGVVLVLTILSIFTVLHVLLTRQLLYRIKSSFALWLERLTDALVWSLITVLVPVTYERISFSPQVVMIIAFNMFVTFIIVMIWDLTRSATNGNYHQTVVLTEMIGRQNTIIVLKWLCGSAFVLAAIDILLGFFPPHNSIVLLVPALYYLLISFQQKFKDFPLIYSFTFSIVSITSCIIIILTYYLIGA